MVIRYESISKKMCCTKREKKAQSVLLQLARKKCLGC